MCACARISFLRYRVISDAFFPVWSQGLADARERLYRIDSEGGSQDSASPALHYQELKMRVDDLCARMDKVQGQLVKAADADQRVARLEVTTLSRVVFVVSVHLQS